MSWRDPPDKGDWLLGLLWFLIALAAIALFAHGAKAQSSTHYKTWPEALRQVEQSGTIPPGWSPPQYAVIRRAEGWAPWTARETTPGKTPETVVIRYGAGGRMDAHYALYNDYRRAKTKVEIRGPCYSACTLVLAYVDEICIAEGAFMAFHAVRSVETGARMDRETRAAYLSMPTAIQGWLDSNGGPENLPLNGFWTMYDRQLWAMGYPKCQ